MNFRDTLERLVWTVIAAFLGSLAAGTVLDVDVLMAAEMAAFTTGVNFVLLVARSRLDALPDPGDGLPGLPRGDGGQVKLATLGVLFLILALGLFVLAAAVAFGWFGIKADLASAVGWLGLAGASFTLGHLV